MTINIEYETDKKLDLDYEKIINEVVNEAAAYNNLTFLSLLSFLLRQKYYFLLSLFSLLFPPKIPLFTLFFIVSNR